MGRKQVLGIHTAVGHKIYVVISSCSRWAERLKNSVCWNLNKMINYSIHQGHLAMLCRVWSSSQPRCSSMLKTLLVCLQNPPLSGKKDFSDRCRYKAKSELLQFRGYENHHSSPGFFSRLFPFISSLV